VACRTDCLGALSPICRAAERNIATGASSFSEGAQDTLQQRGDGGYARRTTRARTNTSAKDQKRRIYGVRSHHCVASAHTALGADLRRS
jgi:hypothetical protein